MDEQKKAQQQLMQLNAVIESQKMMVKLTGQCFSSCVTSPGRDLSSSQQSCLWRCAQNSLESAMFMQRRLMQKAQEQQEHS